MAEATQEQEKRLTAKERKAQIKKENRGWSDEQVDQAYRDEVEQEKTDRFQRVAPRRVNAAAKALQSLGKCGNHGVYSYTPEQASKIIEFITDEFNAMVRGLQEPTGESEDTSFTL